MPVYTLQFLKRIPNQPKSIEGRCVSVAGSQHLSYLFEGLKFDVGKDVALWHGEDLEGHCTVVVLQGRDIIIAHSQLRPSIDLIPDQRQIKTRVNKKNI